MTLVHTRQEELLSSSLPFLIHFSFVAMAFSALRTTQNNSLQDLAGVTMSEGFDLFYTYT